MSISFGKYLHTHPLEESSSSEEDEDFREVMTYKNYSMEELISNCMRSFKFLRALDKGNPDFGASGFVRDADGKIITKHDKDVAGRKNTAKALEVIERCRSFIRMCNSSAFSFHPTFRWAMRAT